jgi:hypothetical protein
MEALLAASSFYDAPARERLAQVEALDAASEPEMRQRAAGELEALYAGVLGEMLDDHSAVLRGIVSHHVAELGIRRLQSQIRASVPGAARSSLSELTDHALALMRQGAGVELGRA